MFIPVLTFLLIFGQTQCLECQSGDRFWCGNICGGSFDLCTCGDTNVTNGEEGCCVSYEESCINFSEHTMFCPNAEAQPLGTYCKASQSCLTERISFSSVPCESDDGKIGCSEEKHSYEVCRGVASCKNAKIEQEYCTYSHQCPDVQETYMCDDQTHAENRHNECRLRSNGGSSSQFDCLNRSDEMTKIFNKTVFKPQRPLSPILNEMLNFDEERLYCRDNVSLRWNSAEELTQLNSLYGNIKYCILKNGETISDFQLYQLVMKDQSFIGRKYFPEGWLDQQFLEYSCNFATKGNNIPCQKSVDGVDLHGICIYPEEVCDGIPHCPNATDEVLDECKKYLSSAAQIECERPNVQLENGMTILTLAIRCNGIVECADGQDEANCQFSNIILYAVLLPGLLFCCVLSYCTLSRITLRIKEGVNLEALSFEDDEINLRFNMSKMQDSLNREEVNRAYFQYVLVKHDRKYSEALNEIKVWVFFYVQANDACH